MASAGAGEERGPSWLYYLLSWCEHLAPFQRCKGRGTERQDSVKQTPSTSPPLSRCPAWAVLSNSAPRHSQATNLCSSREESGHPASDPPLSRSSRAGILEFGPNALPQQQWRRRSAARSGGLSSPVSAPSRSRRGRPPRCRQRQDCPVSPARRGRAPRCCQLPTRPPGSSCPCPPRWKNHSERGLGCLHKNQRRRPSRLNRQIEN